MLPISAIFLLGFLNPNQFSFDWIIKWTAFYNQPPDLYSSPSDLSPYSQFWKQPTSIAIFLVPIQSISPLAIVALQELFVFACPSFHRTWKRGRVNINDQDDDPALIWFRHGLTFDGTKLVRIDLNWNLEGQER